MVIVLCLALGVIFNEGGVANMPVSTLIPHFEEDFENSSLLPVKSTPTAVETAIQELRAEGIGKIPDYFSSLFLIVLTDIACFTESDYELTQFAVAIGLPAYCDRFREEFIRLFKSDASYSVFFVLCKESFDLEVRASVVRKRLAIGLDNFTFITVNRSNLFETSLSALLSRESYGRLLHVSFIGESAVGYGVSREWVSALAVEIFATSGLFSQRLTGDLEDRKYSVYVGGATGEQMRAIGRFLAFCVFYDLPIGVQLPIYYYYKLFKLDVDLAAIASDEPALFNSYSYLLGATEAELNESYEISSTVVTIENRERLIAQALNDLIPSQNVARIDEMLNGFKQFISLYDMKRLFGPKHLQKLIYGEIDISIGDLANNWICDLDWPTHGTSQCTWLLEILESFDMKRRGYFLRFVTGRSKLPIGGFRVLDPLIRVTFSNQVDTLPQSQTCFNMLWVSKYSSKDLMKEKLKWAIEGGLDHLED